MSFSPNLLCFEYFLEYFFLNGFLKMPSFYPQSDIHLAGFIILHHSTEKWYWSKDLKIERISGGRNNNSKHKWPKAGECLVCSCNLWKCDNVLNVCLSDQLVNFMTMSVLFSTVDAAPVVYLVYRICSVLAEWMK